MTSGPAAGEFREVASNTTNLINVTSGNFSPVPTAGGGDSFTIYKTYSIDGTHPTTLGHNLMATAINTALMVPR
jgi:lysophospholipase L1-like esterase